MCRGHVRTCSFLIYQKILAYRQSLPLDFTLDHLLFQGLEKEKKLQERLELFYIIAGLFYKILKYSYVYVHSYSEVMWSQHYSGANKSENCQNTLVQ